MDAPTLHGVSSLVNQRSAGLISSGEFFERLSGLDFVGLDPPGARSCESRADEASTLEPSLLGLQQLQVLTGPEAEALLRQPAKDLGARGVPSSSPLESPANESGHWPRDPLVGTAWGGSVEALGVPALLTERQATALVQERGGPGHPSCRSSAPLEPLDRDTPLWSGSPIAHYPASGDMAELARSLSIDGLSIHSKAMSSQSKHSSRSSASSVFCQRSEHWELRRDQKQEELRRHRDAREMAECSFQPTLLAMGAYGSTSCIGDTSGDQRRFAPPPSARRCKAARSWRVEQEEKELRQCTFAPDVSRSASSMHLSVRSLNSSVSDFALNSTYQAEDNANPYSSMRRSPRSNSSAGSRSRTEDVATSSTFTFSPATNPISKHMVGAQTYARQNVFSRLSQPQSDLEASDPSEEFSTKTQHSGSCDQSQVPASSAPSRTIDPLRDESFFNFLRRQNDFEDNRQQRLAEVERFTAPAGQPELCPQSRKLARQSRLRQDEQQCSAGRQSPRQELKLKTGITAKGCLSSRGPMPTSVLCGLDKSDRGGTSSARAGNTGAPAGMRACSTEAERSDPNVRLDEEATFRPSITAVAARRPARSASEMSSGDATRREARLAQMRAEQSSNAMSFSPQLNSQQSTPGTASSNVESRLRLLEAPDSYLSRVAKERQQKEMKCKEAFDERVAQELAECTFTPQVQRGSPSFVRQMAETYRSVKSLELPEKPQSLLPEWR